MSTPLGSKEKTNTTLCWVLTLFFDWIPPLIFMIASPKGSEIRRQAAIALTGVLVWHVLHIVALFSFVFSPLVFGIAFAWRLVTCIMGAMASKDSRSFKPPILTGLAEGLFKV